MTDVQAATILSHPNNEESDSFLATKVTFDEHWCQDFFLRSRDINVSQHSKTGERIVQGAAIFTVVSAIISQKFPGYLVFGKVEMNFLQNILMDDTLNLTVAEEGKKGRYMRIIIKSFLSFTDKGMAVEGKFNLITPAGLKQIELRKQKQLARQQ